MTLEAITEYSRIATQAVLNQEINIRYRRKGLLDRVQLIKSLPMVSRQVRVRQVEDSEKGKQRDKRRTVRQLDNSETGSRQLVRWKTVRHATVDCETGKPK